MAATSKSKPTIAVEDLATMDGGIDLASMLAEPAAGSEAIDDLTGIGLDDPFTTLEHDPLAEKEAELKAEEFKRATTLGVFPGTVIADELSTTKIGAAYADPIEALITDVGDAPEYMTFVVYGENGTGKTTFGASGDKTLVVEVEPDGTFSVRDRGSKAKKYPVKTWADFEKLYWYLKKNPGKFDILCIDTLTRLSELCMREIVLGEKAKDIELMDKDVIRVTLAQRGDIGQKMVFWLNAFRDLPMHKVWLCQEASGDEKEKTVIYPDLQRKIRVYVCSDATLIGRMVIRMKEEMTSAGLTSTPVYALLTQPNDEYRAKDRTNVFGKGVINPKIEKMIAKVYATE